MRGQGQQRRQADSPNAWESAVFGPIDVHCNAIGLIQGESAGWEEAGSIPE